MSSLSLPSTYDTSALVYSLRRLVKSTYLERREPGLVSVVIRVVEDPLFENAREAVGIVVVEVERARTY